jgi:hypothetical protein
MISLARTIHPAFAVVAYTVVAAITIAGFIDSSTRMFLQVSKFYCFPGSTPVPYTGPDFPNSQSRDSPPFCNEAVLGSVDYFSIQYGYSGHGLFATWPRDKVRVELLALFSSSSSPSSSNKYNVLNVQISDYDSSTLNIVRDQQWCE